MKPADWAQKDAESLCEAVGSNPLTAARPEFSVRVVEGVTRPKNVACDLQEAMGAIGKAWRLEVRACQQAMETRTDVLRARKLETRDAGAAVEDIDDGGQAHLVVTKVGKAPQVVFAVIGIASLPSRVVT